MKPIGKLMVVCVFISLMSLTTGGFGVKAQPAGTIIINPDGSVSGTHLLDRDDSIYRLAGSIYDMPITVLCNGIVLDGEGFTLQGAGGWGTPGVPGVEVTAAINLTCSNVTVTNFSIQGWETGIVGAYNGNIVKGNNITQTENAIAVYADNYLVSGNYMTGSIYAVTIKGDNSLVSTNQIVDNYGGVMIFPSVGAAITENNFTNNRVDLNIGTMGNMLGYEIYDNNFINNVNTTTVLTDSDALGFGGGGTLPSWDNGTVGNYWSDYTKKYPNAAEIDNTGIGNTPYLIRGNPTVIDRYPLMAPVTIQNTTITSPAQMQSPVSSKTSESTVTSPSPTPSPDLSGNIMQTTLIAGLVIALAVCITLLVFRNKLFWLKSN